MELEEYKREKGLRNVDIAKELGVSEAMVSMMSSGKRAISKWEAKIIEGRWGKGVESNGKERVIIEKREPVVIRGEMKEKLLGELSYLCSNNMLEKIKRGEKIKYHTYKRLESEIEEEGRWREKNEKESKWN